MDSPLITKSKKFALQVIKVCNHVKQTKRESFPPKQKSEFFWIKIETDFPHMIYE